MIDGYRFEDEVAKWSKKLSATEAVLTTWLEVQRAWANLQGIFCGSYLYSLVLHIVLLFIFLLFCIPMILESSFLKTVSDLQR